MTWLWWLLATFPFALLVAWAVRRGRGPRVYHYERRWEETDDELRRRIRDDIDADLVRRGKR